MASKRRMSFLGLLKFTAAIAIVYYHSSLHSEQHGALLFLLVEFFLAITGYFTFLHFQKPAYLSASINVKAKEALLYSWQKLKTLIPYVIVGLIFRIIAESKLVSIGELGFATFIKQTLVDGLLLNTFNNDYSTAWAVWYLSAMFIVFPLFCLLCQSKNKNLIYVLLIIAIPTWAFGILGDIIIAPLSLVRVFVGLCFGIAVYGLSNIIKNAKISKFKNLKYYLILTFGAAVWIATMMPVNHGSRSLLVNNYGLNILALIAILAVFFAEKTVLNRISCKVFDFLEMLSIPIFVIHMPLGDIIRYFGLARPLSIREFVYTVAVSVAISIFLVCLVQFVKEYRIAKVLKSRQSS